MEYAFGEINADYVLITNNDVKVDPGVISAFVETAEKEPSTGFVTGKVYYYDEPDTFQTVGKKFDPVQWNGGHIGRMEKDSGQYEQEMELAWCDDIYWLVRKEVWERTGGYDTEFAFQGEDFDWQVRAKQLGYKIFYTPNARMWHKESMTIGKFSPFKAYFDARNPLIIHMKYRTATEFKRFFYSRLNPFLYSIPKLLIKMQFKMFFALIKGYSSALIWGLKNKKLTLSHFI